MRTRIVFSFQNDKYCSIQWYYDQSDADYWRQWEFQKNPDEPLRLYYELIDLDNDKRRIK